MENRCSVEDYFFLLKHCLASFYLSLCLHRDQTGIHRFWVPFYNSTNDAHCPFLYKNTNKYKNASTEVYNTTTVAKVKGEMAICTQEYVKGISSAGDCILTFCERDRMH